MQNGSGLASVKRQKTPPELSHLLGTYRWAWSEHPTSYNTWGHISLGLKPRCRVAKPQNIAGTVCQHSMHITFQSLFPLQETRGSWRIGHMECNDQHLPKMPQELRVSEALDDVGYPFLGLRLTVGAGAEDITTCKMLGKREIRGKRWMGLTMGEMDRLGLKHVDPDESLTPKSLCFGFEESPEKEVDRSEPCGNLEVMYNVNNQGELEGTRNTQLAEKSINSGLTQISGKRKVSVSQVQSSEHPAKIQRV